MAYIFFIFLFIPLYSLSAIGSTRFRQTNIEDIVLREDSFRACERIVEQLNADIELMMQDNGLQQEWFSSDYFLEQMLHLHRSVLKLLDTTQEASSFLPDDIASLHALLYEIAQRLEKLVEQVEIEDYKKLCFFIIIAEAQVILNFLSLRRCAV